MWQIFIEYMLLESILHLMLDVYGSYILTNYNLTHKL